MNSRHLKYERQFWRTGLGRIAGIDEAGRGPLAGPVVAAAVIMPPDSLIRGVDDSKVLSAAEREELYGKIHATALGVGVGIVDHETIDRVNILNASYLAMDLAIRELNPPPDHLLIDGNRFQRLPDSGSPVIPFTLIVDGDARCFSIAAASIVAKVTRDRIMEDYDTRYPVYGFGRNKGYATVEHRDAIFRHGWCDIHRRSFSINQQMEIQFDIESS
jgi:ribonuclease HII